MINPKLKKIVCATFMALVVSNIPNVVLAESLNISKNEMISASTALSEITRSEAENNIREYFQKSKVQNELIRQGVSPDEVSERLASLSEQEIKQFSSQIKEARAGGDFLVAILLVVLIIYLIKRI